jgi:hypothetical protein
LKLSSQTQKLLNSIRSERRSWRGRKHFEVNLRMDDCQQGWTDLLPTLIKAWVRLHWTSSASWPKIRLISKIKVSNEIKPRWNTWPWFGKALTRVHTLPFPAQELEGPEVTITWDEFEHVPSHRSH